MKKQLQLIALLGSSLLVNQSHAILVQMPSKNELAERLNSGSFSHFEEKTRLSNQLGGSEKEVIGVILAVELALADYAQYLGNPMIAMQMQMMKPMLIKTLLKGNESAIAEAEKTLKTIEEMSL